MVAPLLDQPAAPNSVQRIGAGLANLGNTCFLNSVLQCLTYTAPIADYVQKNLHRNSCHRTGFCAMCALEIHVKQALAASDRIISPTYLVKNLSCISRSFHLFRQEDAHEYMRYLIEALHNCCLIEGVSGGSRDTFIQKIFGGKLRSQVKCTVCSHSSNTYDPFLDLSLEISRADSIQKALAHFTDVEVLDGQNKYHCSKCNARVRALKRFTIDEVPQVLTIQLKRFSSSGGFGGKIDKKVLFNTTLDITPFVSCGKGEEAKYFLYAILVHAGWSTHSGHYYCFVHTKAGWFMLDDSRVSQVSERTVLEQKAYILFYVRDVPKQSEGESASLSIQVNKKSGNRNSSQFPFGMRTSPANGHTDVVQAQRTLETQLSNLPQQSMGTQVLDSCKSVEFIDPLSHPGDPVKASCIESPIVPVDNSLSRSNNTVCKSDDTSLLGSTIVTSDLSLPLAVPASTGVEESMLGGHVKDGHHLRREQNGEPKKGKRKKLHALMEGHRGILPGYPDDIHRCKKRKKWRLEQVDILGTCSKSGLAGSGSMSRATKSQRSEAYMKMMKWRRAMAYTMFFRRHFFLLRRRVRHLKEKMSSRD